MATGSYSTKRAPLCSQADFSISYEKKAAPEEILDGPRANLTQKKQYGMPVHDNRLIAVDNLNVLRALAEDLSVARQVKLVYIDPPYATGFDFQSATVGMAYSDQSRGATYLEALRRRLILLHELMSDDGSIYLHLDANMLFPAKMLMDEVFGAKCFRNLITRVKCNPKNQTRKQYGDICDYLLFYTKTDNYVWNNPVEPWGLVEGEQEYHCVEEDTGRRYKKVPCHLPGSRNGETGDSWRGRNPPPGKHWVHSPNKLDELDRDGRIYWSKNGNPRRKLYLDESAGKRRNNLWADFRDTQNQNARVTGYPTEKNMEMLRMIIETSSNPDELILDAYAGSGTTLTASGSLGRRWIGIDSSPTAIAVSIDRLRHGTPRMGSYARKTYIKRAAGENFPDADLSFGFWIDSENRVLASRLTHLL